MRALSLVDSLTSLTQLKQIHNQLLINGFLRNSQFLGQFVATIALKSPLNLDYSNQILAQCDNPTLFAFNSMIRAHSRSSAPQKSFQFYNRILRSGNDLKPDNFTFNFLVRASAQLLGHRIGLSVHAALIKHGFEIDPHVETGLIFMYSELGCLDSCFRVFGSVFEPDLVCRTAMVSACARCGEVGYARKVFDEMPQRDHVAWTAMVAGYEQCGQCREALNLFHSMRIEGVKINEVCMVSVLSACTHLGALDHGSWAHAYIETHNLPMTVTLGTALVDMYSKFGNTKKAMEVFQEMTEKNVYTWSSAMNGLAMNGEGEQCLQLFALMKQNGFPPNEATFTSVLRACSAIGLVDEGLEHFNSMRQVHHIEPKLEQYGCMVDLLARAGKLDEALSFINGMPVKPHAGAWGALLNACRMYNNEELGELASRRLMEIEEKNDNAYVLLSNIYADSENWDKVVGVRRMMKSRGVRKVPGCSVVEVEDENVGKCCENESSFA